MVLAHGLLGFPLLLRKRGGRLERSGFSTRYWGYPSMVGAVEDHAADLARLLAGLAGEPGLSRLHLVGHSMGGIVGWWALQQQVPDRFGRFVLLAPPGRGSWAATGLGWAVRPFGPAVDQLSTRPDSLVNRLAPLPGVEVGVIGAEADLVVPAGREHMPGMKEHRRFPGLHHQLLFRADAAAAVARFLRRGSFGGGGEG